MIDLGDELIQEYLSESREHLATIDTDLLAIEKGGAEIDEELVNRVFRAVHSIKGGAGFFDLVKIGELAHRAEDVLALMRSRKLVPTTAGIGILLRAADQLQALVQNPETSNEADVEEIVAALAGLCGDRPTALENRSAPIVDQASPKGAPLRILLAEDDFSSRFLLQTFLARYGECQVAVNGMEAVEAFRLTAERGERYDLLCMDIMMPVMDGREAVRRVRAMEEALNILPSEGVKIIMTTAVTEVKEVFRCFRELCDAYLVKPVDLGELLKKLKSFQLIQ